MTETMLPFLTLILGALVGMGTSVIASSLQHRRSIALRLLDQYLDVRKSVANRIAPLTNLDSRAELLDHTRLEFRNNVSQLYYAHYDFLPKSVLEALILLDICLGNPDCGPFGVRDDTIVMLTDNEVLEFIERTSLFRSTRLFFAMSLKTSQMPVRRNQVIKLHARYVLHTLNAYASISDLSSMVKALKKQHAR